MGESVVKARHLKYLLDSVDAEPGGRASLLSRIAPEKLRLVQESVGTTWLPFELNEKMDSCILGALGEAGMMEFFRKNWLREFESNLVRPIIEGAISVFGANPRSWSRLIPTGWSSVYRNCGVWKQTDTAPLSVDWQISELPACVVDRAFPLAIAGAFRGFLELSRHTGTVELSKFEPGTRTACLRLHWDAGAAPEVTLENTFSKRRK